MGLNNGPGHGFGTFPKKHVYPVGPSQVGSRFLPPVPRRVPVALTSFSSPRQETSRRQPPLSPV